MTGGKWRSPSLAERRLEPREQPTHVNWQRLALVKPAVPVHVLNVSRSGCLVEGTFRLRPGARTTLTVVIDGEPKALAVSCVRSRISAISPVRYEAALTFLPSGYRVGAALAQK